MVVLMMKRSLLSATLPFVLAACGQAGTAAVPSGAAPSSPAASPAVAASPSTKPVAAGSAAASVASPSGSGAARSAAAKPAISSAPSVSANAGTAASNGGSAEEQTIRAVQQVGPGVVKITHPVQGGQALGSGTIVDAKGYILTNAHVAEGATSYQVTLANNQAVQGKLVGLDPFDDLAVIQINQPDLPVVEMGDSSKLQVG